MNPPATPAPPVFAVVIGLTLLAGLFSVGVAAFAWRHRPAAGATAMSLLSVATGWWAFGYVAELLLVDQQAKLLVARVEWFGVLAGPVAWVAFAFAYSGRDRYAAPTSLLALSAVPAVGVVAVWTNQAHHLVWTTTDLVSAAGGELLLLERAWGPLYWLLVGYSYLLWFAGAVLVVRTAVALPTVYRFQAATVVLGAALPLVGNVATVSFYPTGVPLDVTPAAFAGTSLACVVALRQYELFDARPVPRRVSRDRVVEDLVDPVIVTDTRWRVTDLNRRAARLFDADRDSLQGRHATELLPSFTPRATGESARLVETIPVPRERTDRHFEVRASDFTDRRDRPVGNAIVLRDVTERQRTLQRLGVLNRVLRHNLRNEASVVTGYADLVASDLDRGDAEAAREHAETIQRSASDLVDIGEKARLLDAVVSDDDATGERTAAVPDLVRTAIDDVRDEHPEARVAIGALPDGDVRCPAALDPVLREVVENGVEHDPADAPHVVTWATVDGDDVVVHVSDDAGGIPPDELAALEADVETPLLHGSGLGLWLVTLGVRHVGGDVAFRNRNHVGTLVTLRVPVVGTADW